MQLWEYSAYAVIVLGILHQVLCQDRCVWLSCVYMDLQVQLHIQCCTVFKAFH